MMTLSTPKPASSRAKLNTAAALSVRLDAALREVQDLAEAIKSSSDCTCNDDSIDSCASCRARDEAETAGHVIALLHIHTESCLPSRAAKRQADAIHARRVMEWYGRA